MIDLKKYLVNSGDSARIALRALDKQGQQGSVLFVVDKKSKLLGSLTDGDIRRGLLKNLSIDDAVDDFMKSECSYLNSTNETVNYPQCDRYFRYQ